jgi:hypothetical protein
MFVLNRRLVCAVVLPYLAGCQVCNPSLKKSCADSCGPEYHVNAPAQKVVVQRERAPEAPCAEEARAPRETPPEARAPSPQRQPANLPQQQPAMAPQGYAAAPQPPGAAQMPIAPLIGGLAAIPSLPTNMAFTLSFDVIKIPIPIPRLRTVEVPPETRLSYVQLGGANAAIASPMMPAAVAPAGYVQQAAEQECIRPEQLAAAIALLRSQRQEPSGPTTNGSSPSPAAVSKAEEELNKRAKQLDDIERKLEEATKRLEAKQKGAAATPAEDSSWRPRADKN